ncbi:MAG: peptide ABC transporter [Bacillota bacterium]|nr:peptide ABC transporter [Bacillota bacterium]REJ37872.1 MAG: peptide ABC transporter [Bacillota bacterium]
MHRFLIRRLLLAIPILLLVSIMSFLLIHLIPGDPALVILGPEAPPDAVEAMRRRLGLDRPLPVQYAAWLGNVLRGDLGNSLVNNMPVTKILMDRLPATVHLTVGAFLVAVLVAVPVGVVSAVRRASLPDYLGTLFALTGLSVPNFWLGILLILYFSVRLGWLPAGGFVPLWEDPGRSLLLLLLPVLTTGLRESAVVTRQVRSSMLEVLHADYVRTARAKGLNERVVIYRHALRNALIPVVTVSGLQVAGLMGGLIITETIFAIPGVGRVILDAILTRDFVTLQGAVLVAAVSVVLVNILVDILYALLDPRIRLDGGRGAG